MSKKAPWNGEKNQKHRPAMTRKNLLGEEGQEKQAEYKKEKRDQIGKDRRIESNDNNREKNGSG